jgi:hypothetical protein
MGVVARIFGLSVLAGALGAMLGATLFHEMSDHAIPVFLLGCVGAIVGAVAGAAREISAAMRQRPSS